MDGGAGATCEPVVGAAHVSQQREQQPVAALVGRPLEQGQDCGQRAPAGEGSRPRERLRRRLDEQRRGEGVRHDLEGRRPVVALDVVVEEQAVGLRQRLQGLGDVPLAHQRQRLQAQHLRTPEGAHVVVEARQHVLRAGPDLRPGRRVLVREAGDVAQVGGRVRRRPPAPPRGAPPGTRGRPPGAARPRTGRAPSRRARRRARTPRGRRAAGSVRRLPPPSPLAPLS